MNLQKYRTHGVGRHPFGLFWGAAGDKGSRVMSYHRLLQLWIAGVVAGVMIALILLDVATASGSMMKIIGPFLVIPPLILALHAVFWAPRPGDKPDNEADDEDSLSFR